VKAVDDLLSSPAVARPSGHVRRDLLPIVVDIDHEKRKRDCARRGQRRAAILGACASRKVAAVEKAQARGSTKRSSDRCARMPFPTWLPSAHGAIQGRIEVERAW